MLRVRSLALALLLSATTAHASTDPLRLRTEWHVLGDVTEAATCIRYADPVDGGPTGGTLRLRGIPAGAQVISAWLYWSVLSDATPVDTGTPSFNGVLLSNVERIGDKTATPCFAAFPRTGIFRADVTSLVGADGNYRIAGFPSTGTSFAEGATLVVVYCGGDSLPRHVMLWDGIDVTSGANPIFRQTLSGFVAPPATPFDARVLLVAGNGQPSEPDPLYVNGTDFDAIDPSILSGSLCGDPGLYDLTLLDVAALLAPGATSAAVEADTLTDCYTIGALVFVITDVPATAGLVPEPSALDLRPGAVPLRVTKNGALLHLAWEPLGSRFDVLSGRIGSWYSHAPLSCGLGSAQADVPRDSINRYYLAVAVGCGTSESSKGRTSFGVERPTALAASGSACR